MFSDRDVEIYYAPFDPAYRSDDEEKEHDETEQIIMGDLFAQLEKVFAQFDKYEKEIMMDHDTDIVDKVYELMEG